MPLSINNESLTIKAEFSKGNYQLKVTIDRKLLVSRENKVHFAHLDIFIIQEIGGISTLTPLTLINGAIVTIEKDGSISSYQTGAKTNPAAFIFGAYTQILNGIVIVNVYNATSNITHGSATIRNLPFKKSLKKS